MYRWPCEWEWEWVGLVSDSRHVIDTHSKPSFLELRGEEYLRGPRIGTGSGSGSGRGIPHVVGAAASDALHMAFAATEEWPDQAQFNCVIRTRGAEQSSSSSDVGGGGGGGGGSGGGGGGAGAGGGGSGGGGGGGSGGGDGGAGVGTGSLWLEITVDGATYILAGLFTAHLLPFLRSSSRFMLFHPNLMPRSALVTRCSEGY